MTETLLALESATLGYDGDPILVDVSLSIERGELFALIGRNGTGKSTLLAAFLGTLAPKVGTRTGSPRIGFAPQRGELDPVFPFLAREVVAMGLVGRGRYSRGETKRLVDRALETAGLLEKAETAFRDLSGGQRQRAMIARALVAEPEVLILDEPTNDLDVEGQVEVVELIRRLNSEGRTIVFVSHALELVKKTAKRVGVLSDRTLTLVEPERLDDEVELARLLGIATPS